jgi:hypothetical protein
MYEEIETTKSQTRSAGDTGIASNDMYRMSRSFCDGFRTRWLSANAHRVLHALLYLTCRKLPTWSSDVWQVQEGYRAECMLLRRILGLESRNSNRDWRAGIAELVDVEIFDHLHLVHDNSWLCWRFKDEVLSWILSGHSYGLMDARALTKLRDATDFQMYNHVSVARRTWKAKCVLSVADIGIWMQKADPRWPDIRDGFIKALKLSCAHYDLSACVLLECHGHLRGIDTIEIRLRRVGGGWRFSELAASHTFTRRCLLVDGTHQKDVVCKELPVAVKALQKAQWRVEGLLL